MNTFHKSKGLTLMEAMIALVIIAIVVAILTPVFANTKRAAKISQSVSNMRQLYVAIQIYRDEHDGFESYDSLFSFYHLGLPRPELIQEQFFHNEQQIIGSDRKLWFSPCGDDEIITRTWFKGNPGEVTYIASEYNPVAMMMPHPYADYLRTYRQNSLILADPFCNPSGTDMRMFDQITTKTVIVTQLSGTLKVLKKRGGTTKITELSEKPE